MKLQSYQKVRGSRSESPTLGSPNLPRYIKKGRKRFEEREREREREREMEREIEIRERKLRGRKNEREED